MTADNYFTDLDLATHLLSNGLMVVGTVKPNQKVHSGKEGEILAILPRIFFPAQRETGTLLE